MSAAPAPRRVVASRAGRALCLAVGVVFFALSLISFVVPVLPTVPLLIVTAALFSRGSERWHAWLLARPRLGPPLAAWERHGVITRATKLTTTTLMCVFLAYPVAFSALPRAERLGAAAMALAVFAFLWTRPSTPVEKIDDLAG